MKQILFFVFLLLNIISHAQYIGVRARYTETRLVDDAPNPPKRENRLILSFYEVSPSGVYTPTVLFDYSIWVYKKGLQFGNVMGGVLDSTGNNYPGYTFPAPKVVSYYNTLGLNYIDCDPNTATSYVVNGHELDCGFVTVSYWDMDWGTMVPFEAFPAPNVCLTLYDFTHPYYYGPGNVNFSASTVFPGPPYNMYNFHCGGPLQLVVRGILPADSGGFVTLPVKFMYERGIINSNCEAELSWSNMTESDILHYDIERSIDGATYTPVAQVQPLLNNWSRADYSFTDHALGNSGTVFYRIKAVESTRPHFYSSVIRLSGCEVATATRLTIYPNPVKGSDFTFRLTNAQPGRYISMILSPDGKQLKQKMIDHATSGDLVRQIEIEGLPRGSYRLVLFNIEARYSSAFVIFYP